MKVRRSIWALTLLLAAVALDMAGGCRSAKKIQKVITTPKAPDTAQVPVVRPEKTAADLHADSMAQISQTLAQMNTNYIDFKTFSAKVRVHYEGSDGRDYDVNAFVHIKKDSLIWVAVNAGLGIEAFRMLVTPDSVKILDKLKKIVQLRSVSYLQEQVHLPVDFKTLQDLLIGNPIFLDTARIVYYRKEPAGLSLFSSGLIFRNYLTLNPDDHTIRHSKLDDTDPLRSRTCDITYGEYDTYDNGMRFSTYRKISVAEKSKLDIELEYKQFKFNEALSFNFVIPKNYKRR
jgi:hypothetical protein